MAIENDGKNSSSAVTHIVGNNPTNMPSSPPANKVVQQTMIMPTLPTSSSYSSNAAAPTGTSLSAAIQSRLDDSKQLNLNHRHHNSYHNHYLPPPTQHHHHTIGLSLPQNKDGVTDAESGVTRTNSTVGSASGGGNNLTEASFNGNCNAANSSGSSLSGSTIMGSGNGIIIGNSSNHISATGATTPVTSAPPPVPLTVGTNHCNKSETSSNASINSSSIKKVLSSNTLMNSREDVTSLGGASSTNSQSTTNNTPKGGNAGEINEND